MHEDRTEHQHKQTEKAAKLQQGFSWWSWRPGIKPLYVFALGGCCAGIGLLLTTLGAFLLFFAIGKPGTALFPLFLGLLLFCYPIVITRWAWRDMFIEKYAPEYLYSLTGTVIARRNQVLQQPRRPGMIPLTRQNWLGIALQPEGPATRIITLHVSEGHYQRAEEGTRVRVIFTPHLHYVHKVEQILP